MAEIDWAILCDYAFLDVGRKSCLIGTFDRIFTPSVPAQHNQLAVVVKFSGQPEEIITFTLELARPPTGGGGTLLTLNRQAKAGERGTAEVTTNIVGLQLPDYGIYAFNIYTENRLLKTVTFNVERLEARQTDAPPT